MPNIKRTPTKDILARLIGRHQPHAKYGEYDHCPVQPCAGRRHTSRDIARAYGTTKAAVDKALLEYGLTRTQPKKLLPWPRINPAHLGLMPATMLRYALAGRTPGRIPYERRQEYASWLAARQRNNDVVVYDYDQGFSYAIRQKGDAQYYRPWTEEAVRTIDQSKESSKVNAVSTERVQTLTKSLLQRGSSGAGGKIKSDQSKNRRGVAG